MRIKVIIASLVNRSKELNLRQKDLNGFLSTEINLAILKY